MFIDVSHWQGKIDWNKAISNGVEGAYIKATGSGVYGNYTDDELVNNITAPLKYKGFYHFFDYRTNAKKGADQCKYFLDTVGLSGNLRGALDFENNEKYFGSIYKVWGHALTEAMNWCLEYEKETGHAPTFYCGSSNSQTRSIITGYSFRNFARFPLWVAHYTSAKEPTFGCWTDYALWQYSTQGDPNLYGITGSKGVDLDMVNDMNALLKPGTTIEDPVIVPAEPTDAEKLRILWEAYKAYQNK